MDEDDLVVHLDGDDDRTQIGLPDRGVAGDYPPSQESADALDLIRLQCDLGRKLNLDALQGYHGPVAVRFERSAPVCQRLVDVRDAIEIGADLSHLRSQIEHSLADLGERRPIDPSEALSGEFRSDFKVGLRTQLQRRQLLRAA